MKNKIEKDSFITEIEEDLKNDNLKKLWDKYGVYVIATMAAILLVTIIVEVYSYFKIKNNQEETAQYSQAMTLKATGNNDFALASFANIVAEGGFLSGLAMIEEASILKAQGKNAEAQEKLLSVIDNKDADSSVVDSARMILASQMVDGKKTIEVEEVLRPLFDNNNSWKYSAYELLAASYLKAGNKEKAIEIFEMIANSDSSSSIKNRASDMLSVLR